jgi:hypothetical protein
MRMAKRPRSTGTGRFVICYGATLKSDHQVYLEVKQGPSGSLFVHCPLCGLKAFLNGPFWWDAGWPLEEIRRHHHFTHIVAATPPWPAPDTGASKDESPARGRADMLTPKQRSRTITD